MLSFARWSGCVQWPHFSLWHQKSSASSVVVCVKPFGFNVSQLTRSRLLILLKITNHVDQGTEGDLCRGCWANEVGSDKWWELAVCEMVMNCPGSSARRPPATRHSPVSALTAESHGLFRLCSAGSNPRRCYLLSSHTRWWVTRGGGGWTDVSNGNEVERRERAGPPRDPSLQLAADSVCIDNEFSSSQRLMLFRG